MLVKMRQTGVRKASKINQRLTKLKWIRETMKDMEDNRIAIYTLFVSSMTQPGDSIQYNALENKRRHESMKRAHCTQEKLGQHCLADQTVVNIDTHLGKFVNPQR